VEAVVVAGAIAIAAFLVVERSIFRHVLALVRETKQDGRHSTVTVSAKLNGCGEVGVEVTPPELKHRAR
jgi:hypothetical protein